MSDESASGKGGEMPFGRDEMIRRRNEASRLGVFRPELHVLQNVSEDEALTIWGELVPFAGPAPVAPPATVAQGERISMLGADDAEFGMSEHCATALPSPALEPPGRWYWTYKGMSDERPFVGNYVSVADYRAAESRAAELERELTSSESSWHIDQISLKACADAVYGDDWPLAWQTPLPDNIRALSARATAAEAVAEGLRKERDLLLIKPVPASVVITALQAELGRARKDAERYRWLRGRATVPYGNDSRGEVQHIIVFWDGPVELDTAIDAARPINGSGEEAEGGKG